MAEIGNYFPILIVWTVTIYLAGFIFFGFPVGQSAEDINATVPAEPPDSLEEGSTSFVDAVESFIFSVFDFFRTIWSFVTFSFFDVPTSLRIVFIIVTWLPWSIFWADILIRVAEMIAGLAA